MTVDTAPATLVIDVFDDPMTLDPHKAFDTSSRHPVLNIYDGLLGLDEDRRPYPVLAADLPVATGRGGTWEVAIPIRGGIRFHDRTPLTVDDVVYSLRRMAITADGPASLWADALLGAPLTRLSEAAAAEMAGRITAGNDGVLLRLPAPYRPIDLLLVQWSLVVSRPWCAERGEWDGDLATVVHFLRRGRTPLDEQANGTGPYALHGWDRTRRVLTFRTSEARTSAARGGPAATVVLRSVDDRRERERELLAGECDFSVCQPESRRRLGRLEGIVLEKLPEEWSINPLGFITQRLDPRCAAVGSGVFGPGGLPPAAFGDVHLRRMLSLCFDHAAYVDDVLDGEALTHSPPFPAGAIRGLDVGRGIFDPDLARAEWSSAWDGHAASAGCRIVITTHAANISRVRAAEYLARGLRAVSDGIEVEIDAVDFNTLNERLYAGQCPVAFVGWASDFLHPFAFASALLDPRAPLPAALGIDDAVLADLVLRARQAEPEEEAAVYRRMAEYAADQALFLAPPGKISYMTYADRWQGVRLKHHVPNVLDFASFRARVEAERPE
ncbi:MAG: ABC transporter substrate-binding protein [Acidimicrobiia bacterium]